MYSVRFFSMLLDSCCGTSHIVRRMHSVWQLEAQIIQSQSTKIHLHRHTILRISFNTHRAISDRRIGQANWIQRATTMQLICAWPWFSLLSFVKCTKNNTIAFKYIHWVQRIYWSVKSVLFLFCSTLSLRYRNREFEFNFVNVTIFIYYITKCQFLSIKMFHVKFITSAFFFRFFHEHCVLNWFTKAATILRNHQI